MKKLIILILICNNLYSQKYEVVDSIVKSYSNNVTTIDDLVSKINLDFDTNENKTRATFYWISNNINYDVAFLEILKNNGIKTFSYKSESERIKKEDKFILELANKTIKSKLAVCLGYSALFQIICKKLKIDCKIIKGNLKSDINQIGQNLEINHAWNFVKINNKWELVDCTLAAGKISTKTNLFIPKYNDSFFFTKPEFFALNHFPEDKEYSLKSLSKEDFIELPVYYPDYIKENYKMNAPKNGNLSSKNHSLSIFFENPEIVNNKVEYYFLKDKEFVIVENEEKTLNYVIPFNSKSNDAILIYVNRKLIVGYKLI